MLSDSLPYAFRFAANSLQIRCKTNASNKDRMPDVYRTAPYIQGFAPRPVVSVLILISTIESFSPPKMESPRLASQKHKWLALAKPDLILFPRTGMSRYP